jgi:hypothetical protein
MCQLHRYELAVDQRLAASFPDFVEELKESFWGDLQGEAQRAAKKFFELLSERQRDRYMVCFVNVDSVDRIIYSIFQRFKPGMAKPHPQAIYTSSLTSPPFVGILAPSRLRSSARPGISDCSGFVTSWEYDATNFDARP